MKRRDFITLLGGAAAAWPLAVRAQQAHVPVVGVLRPNRQDVLETFAEPFRRYMKAIGWEEGRNIRFLFAWMGGHNERAMPRRRSIISTLLSGAASSSGLRSAAPCTKPTVGSAAAK